MLKVLPLPRPLSAAVLALTLAVAIVFPASSLAAPPEGVTVSPSPGTFPKTTVGTSSPAQEFEIANGGEEQPSIETIVVEGLDSADFNFIGPSCGGPLSPGYSCAFLVAFAPSSVGEKQAMVSIHFEGSGQTLVLPVSGTAVAPQLTFEPGSYDYGVLPVNSNQYANLQLANTGEAAVQVDSFEIIGPSSSAFYVGATECYSPLLDPGDSCLVQVYFTSVDAVAYSAQVRASASGVPFTADLAGTGGRPVVEGSPSPAGFGAATVGTTGTTRTITLTNSGNLPAAAYYTGVISGGDTGSFRLLDESCTAAPLEPASSCTAHIRFAPVSAGPKAAKLSFLSETLLGETKGSIQITLTGKGVAPAVTLAPSGFGFGRQATGTKSKSRLFAVRNEGSVPFDLGAAAIVGANLDQFVLSGDTCTGVALGAGGECRLRVRFAPDSRGAKAATLRIGGDAGAFTASLSGRGTHARHRPRHRRRHRKTLGAIHPRIVLRGARQVAG